MSDNGFEQLDEREWNRRAAQIGTAIRQAFPITLLDQECLRKMIEEASRPPTPKGGLFTRIFANLFPPWVDTELSDFLKLLRNHDWTQIDWNHNWMAITLLPDAAFVYCLPGILHWYMTDANAMPEAVEGLIDHSLASIFLKQNTIGSHPYTFNAEQKHLIADAVRLLRDLLLSNNQRIGKVANDIILCLIDV